MEQRAVAKRKMSQAGKDEHIKNEPCFPTYIVEVGNPNQRERLLKRFAMNMSRRLPKTLRQLHPGRPILLLDFVCCESGGEECGTSGDEI